MRHQTSTFLRDVLVAGTRFGPYIFPKSRILIMIRNFDRPGIESVPDWHRVNQPLLSLLGKLIRPRRNNR